MTTVVIKKKLKEYILNLNFLRIVGFALLKIYVSITNQRRKKKMSIESLLMNMYSVIGVAIAATFMLIIVFSLKQGGRKWLKK